MNETNANGQEIDNLKQSLIALTKDLFFPSETDAPIEVISVGSLEDLKNVPEKGGDNTTSEVAFDDFMQMYGTKKDWQNDIQKNFANKFGEALRILDEHLKTVKIFRLGNTRATVFILGQGSDEQWHGLKTSIVET